MPMKKLFLPLRFILLTAALAVLGPATPADGPDQGESAGQGDSEEPLETFIPTEKLPADSAISFPVDI